MDFTRECPECNGKTVRLVQCQLCKNVKCKHSQALKYLSPTDWFMMLTDEEKETACLLCIKAGAAFVKTSTGMGTGGATVHDVELLTRVADGKIAVKASGGVDNRETAYAMLNAGASRLGVSKVPQIVNDDTSMYSASKGNQPPKFD